MGHSIPQTLRVTGQIGKHKVATLVDSGSTHNLIQDRIAKLLDLPAQQARSFQVLVGNGEELKCSSICPQVPLQMGPNQFLVDLYVLPISGAELVLGVQWLKTLGPVLTDYNHLTMHFIKRGRGNSISGRTQTKLRRSILASIPSHGFYQLPGFPLYLTFDALLPYHTNPFRTRPHYPSPSYQICRPLYPTHHLARMPEQPPNSYVGRCRPRQCPPI